MTHPWHICILIPARNEEELLPRCLGSLFAARARLPLEVSCDIVVAVDASTDGTALLAEGLLQGYGAVVVTEDGKVGAARAAAAALALKRYQGPLSSCWLANTDADCLVPQDWLLQHLTCAEEGAEAIAGVVSVDSFHEHTAQVEGRFRRAYLVESNDKHLHVHGANLGVRADLYRRVGGWARLSTAEDHDLWSRIEAASQHSISTAQVTVVTSGRRIGRAPHGFAEALAAHNEAVA